jgi:uncharacterized protein YraI
MCYYGSIEFTVPVNNSKMLPKKKSTTRIILFTCGTLLVLSLCLIGIIVTSVSSSESKGSRSNAATINAAVLIIRSSQTAITPSITPTQSITPTLTPTITLTPVPNVIIGQDTNIRSGPDQSYSIERNLLKGEIYQVFSKSEDDAWLSLDASNQLWINSSVVTISVPINNLPIASTYTPTATITPIPPIVIEDIYKNYKQLTKLQFSNYKNGIIGRMVEQYVIVGNVSEKGIVSLSGDWSPEIINFSDFGVALTGVPLEIASTLTGGGKYYLKAQINNIVGDYNYFSNRETVVVLQFIRFGN